MKKPKTNLLLILISIIVLLILVGAFISVKYIEAKNSMSEKDKILSKIYEFEKYSLEYGDEISRTSEILSGMEIDLDYTTCVSYVNKYSELHKKFNKNEQEKLLFLEKVSSNEECLQNTDKSFLEINNTKEKRNEWRLKLHTTRPNFPWEFNSLWE